MSSKVRPDDHFEAEEMSEQIVRFINHLKCENHVVIAAATLVFAKVCANQNLTPFEVNVLLNEVKQIFRLFALEIEQQNSDRSIEEKWKSVWNSLKSDIDSL